MLVALVDDHPLLTESIKNTLLLQPGVGQVKTYNSADIFLSEKLVPVPDIVITDLMMPGTNGLKLIEAIRKLNNDKIKILVLSSINDVQTIKQVIRAGANGYLSKASPLEELIEAIFEINEGRQYIAKSLRESMLNTMFTEEQVVYHLSPREKEVLHKVCSGLTIKEIAYDLDLSAHTVQYYHRSVLTKLKVKRTTDLIVFAMQHGLYIPDIDQQKK
ncbi:response regulator transcription factor [Ferruginibacter sp. SUN106]|uniref:response regulator transcription factor n=1 Tax=Ferruginibacter sp. SUN106 TaxID=2978348 RepID=UPI003D36593A